MKVTTVTVVLEVGHYIKIGDRASLGLNISPKIVSLSFMAGRQHKMVEIGGISQAISFLKELILL